MKKMCYIKWIDSCAHTTGWTSRDELDKKLHINHLLFETVGWLYKETPYSYIVSQTQGVHDDHDIQRVDAVLEIPKVAVMTKYIKSIKEENKKHVRK